MRPEPQGRVSNWRVEYGFSIRLVTTVEVEITLG
jgi:hypothetical protein